MAPKFINAAKHGRRFRGAFAMALTGMLAAAPVHADTGAVASCKHTADEKSVYVRALQTDLMVAALTCSSSVQYNSFIHQFQPVLTKDYKELQTYYKKRHGKAGTTELNAFITHLANDESQRSIQEGSAAYCDESGKLLTAVLALQSDQLEDFSATQIVLPADAPVKQCAVPKTQTAAVIPAAAGSASATAPAAGAPASGPAATAIALPATSSK